MASSLEKVPLENHSQVRHKTFGWRGVVEHATDLYSLISWQDGGQQWCLRSSVEIVSVPKKWNAFADLAT